MHDGRSTRNLVEDQWRRVINEIEEGVGFFAKESGSKGRRATSLAWQKGLRSTPVV
jgi:hypothetical protein